MMMLLNDSDIEAIVEHIGETVQFYDENGIAGNNLARHEIREALRSYVGTPSSKAAERFELVRGIIEKRLSWGAREAVALADAVLAAMASEPTKTPGPSSLAAVRAELQEWNRKQSVTSTYPTNDRGIVGLREGRTLSVNKALEIINRAMETPEAEMNDDKTK